MSHFEITADEVNKILAQAKFLIRNVDGQRYEVEKWSQLFAKLPRECVKKILVVLGGEEESEKIEFCLVHCGKKHANLLCSMHVSHWKV